MNLFLACALTVIIETAYFLLRGYRGTAFIVLCFAANVATNLSLNLLLSKAGHPVWLIVLLELAAVGIEYAVYRPAVGRRKDLLADTFAANALSFFLGGLLIRLIL